MSFKFEHKTIFKHYSLVRLISKGGFGTVYEAINLQNSRLCAVKATDIVGYKGNNFDLFLNEGRILKNITDHRHIIKMYSEKVYGTMRLLELELLEMSLNDLIQIKAKAGGSFTEDEAKTIIKHLLMGLQYLHSNDLIHRDLKPENVGFVNSNDLSSLKIFDFGLSAQLTFEDNRMMHSMVGTILYMAPEMFSMNEYNAVD